MYDISCVERGPQVSLRARDSREIILVTQPRLVPRVRKINSACPRFVFGGGRLDLEPTIEYQPFHP